MKKCPRCGRPGGQIYCPACHGPRSTEAPAELLAAWRKAHGQVLSPERWADMLIARDDVQGAEVLRRMVAWYEENDGKSWDFGELLIVKDARRALETAALPGRNRKS